MHTRLLRFAGMLTALLGLLFAVSATSAPIVTAAPNKATAGKNITIKKIRTTAEVRSLADRSNGPLGPERNLKAPNVNRSIPRAASAKDARGLGVPVAGSNGIDGDTPGLLNSAAGLDSYASRLVNGFNVTPPDQGLCASPKFVFEAVNLVVRVFNTEFGSLSAVVSLNEFFGLDPDVFTSDPKCYFDQQKKRFFFTILVIGPGEGETPRPDSNVGANELPAECIESCVLVAVSRTKNPLLDWNIYAIDTANEDHPGCPCLGDQPLIGANRDGFFVSTNEYSIEGPEFNGAQLYAFDKKGMADGFNQIVGVAWDVGSIPTPDDVCCWYSVQPATSPHKSQWDNSQGGTEYFLSALEFFGLPDNRIAFWAVTNTQSLHSFAPDPLLYLNVLDSQTYSFPPDGVQKDGPHPEGESLGEPVGLIAANDDRMNQTVYSQNLIWGGLNSALDVNGTVRTGTAYFAVQPTWSGGALFGTIVHQGYVALRRAYVLYPSIGVTASGKVVFTASLTGNQYWPSAVYAVWNGSDFGPLHIYGEGRSPLDDFCEYPENNCADTDPPSARPRFGDYSAAVAVGEKVYLATEYVARVNCSVEEWNFDRTCGGRRGTRTNWGTRLGVVEP